MKVVINTCFGGFGLSPQAEQYYLNLKGEDCFFYIQTKHKWKDGKEEYKKVTAEQINGLLSFTYTKDKGEIMNKLESDDYWYSRNIERDDPLLIKTVQDLGHAADGAFAQLKVVEIPDNIVWNIHEYDGHEHVEEKHKTWY